MSRYGPSRYWNFRSFSPNGLCNGLFFNNVPPPTLHRPSAPNYSTTFFSLFFLTMPCYVFLVLLILISPYEIHRTISHRKICWWCLILIWGFLREFVNRNGRQFDCPMLTARISLVWRIRLAHLCVILEFLTDFMAFMVLQEPGGWRRVFGKTPFFIADQRPHLLFFSFNLTSAQERKPSIFHQTNETPKFHIR